MQRSLLYWLGLTFCIGLSASDANCAVAAQVLSGAGSTAAAPVYKAWAAEYAQIHDVTLAYQGVGSTAGLQKIKAHEVAFGASDVAPPEKDLAASGLVLVPMFVTGAVPVVNLAGVPRGQLRLTGEVLGAIYLGSITSWNAPEIQTLNPGVRLPAEPIRPVARSDGSGTTYYFTDFLTRASPAFHAKYPNAATSLSWPASVIGAKGSDGVAAAVLAAPGAIGYIDFNYVADKNLSPVKMKDALGDYVEARQETFSNALRASDWFLSGDFHSTLANLPAKDAWPITMGTFVIMQKVTADPDTAKRALDFFLWALVKGDATVNTMSFVHLPDKVQALAYRNMSSIVTTDGRAIGFDAMGSVVTNSH